MRNHGEQKSMLTFQAYIILTRKRKGDSTPFLEKRIK